MANRTNPTFPKAVQPDPSGIVYKCVDFVKTEAIKRTRQDTEKIRNEKKTSNKDWTVSRTIDFKFKVLRCYDAEHNNTARARDDFSLKPTRKYNGIEDASQRKYVNGELITRFITTKFSQKYFSDHVVKVHSMENKNVSHIILYRNCTIGFLLLLY